MLNMRPVDWEELVKLCKTQGCKFDRQRGDHYIMTKPGLRRPVVIPKKRGLKEDIVLSVGVTPLLSERKERAEISGFGSGTCARAAFSVIEINS